MSEIVDADGRWVNGSLVEPSEAWLAARGAAPAPDPVTDPDAPADESLLVAAEEAYRAAYDEVIAAGSLSMSRINQAIRAGSDARLAVLDG